MSITARKLIEHLKMSPHREGGWYSGDKGFGSLLPADALVNYSGARFSASHIYYLLQKGEESRWHKLQSAERWLWHMGGSLITTLGGEGIAPKASSTLSLGSNFIAGEQLSTLVPASHWQTTRLASGDFALVSCIVSPAFHEDDFIM